MKRWGHWTLNPESTRLIHAKSGAWVSTPQVRAYREIPGAIEHAAEWQVLDRQDILHLLAALIDVIADRERAR